MDFGDEGRLGYAGPPIFWHLEGHIIGRRVGGIQAHPFLQDVGVDRHEVHCRIEVCDLLDSIQFNLSLRMSQVQRSEMQPEERKQ